MRNKAWGSTPTGTFANNSLGNFNKSMPTFDMNMMGMYPGMMPNMAGLNNMNSSSSGFPGMQMMGGYPNMGMTNPFAMGISQNDHHNLMPSMAYQFSNMNLSNQNQFFPGQSSGSPLPLSPEMSHEQLKLLLSMHGHNLPQSAPAKTPESMFSAAQRLDSMGSQSMTPGMMSHGMGGMSQMMPSSTHSHSKPMSSTFNHSNLTEMSKVFLNSMKDLSGKNKATGTLKFFNEGKGFGFFVSDIDGKDVFFHYEDVKDLKLTKDFLREAKNKYIVKFAFTTQVYYGKYNYSVKAVDIELLGILDARFIHKNEPTLTN